MKKIPKDDFERYKKEEDPYGLCANLIVYLETWLKNGVIPPEWENICDTTIDLLLEGSKTSNLLYEMLVNGVGKVIQEDQTKGDTSRDNKFLM